jgi:hypothetical protein
LVGGGAGGGGVDNGGGGERRPTTTTTAAAAAAIAHAVAELARALSSERACLADASLADAAVADGLLHLWRRASSVAAEVIGGQQKEEEAEEEGAAGVVPPTLAPLPLPLPLLLAPATAGAKKLVSEVPRPGPALLDRQQRADSRLAAYQVREEVGSAAVALRRALLPQVGRGSGSAVSAACEGLAEAGLLEEDEEEEDDDNEDDH